LTVFVLTVCSAGLAAAAVTPELGYVRLLKGENRFCDGTQCSGGCCPYANYDCCDDGTHCANNVQSCPGCPKKEDGDGHMTGGWCKAHIYEFGEETENTLCCLQDTQYCVHEDDNSEYGDENPTLEMYAGECQDTYDEFCDSDEGVKCGKDCCPLGDYVCCPDNTCSNDQGVCDFYCGGDWCGPDPTFDHTGQECCLSPNICCPDGTTTVCTDDETDCVEIDGVDKILCGPNENEAVVCDTTLADPQMCCPDNYPGCYKEGDDLSDGVKCGGVECGTGSGLFCIGETPYCCPDETKGCVKHLDDCDDLAPPPECTEPGQDTDCAGGLNADKYCCAISKTCVNNGQLCDPKECGEPDTADDVQCVAAGGATTYCCEDGINCATDQTACPE